jgi:hypothetical protein
MTPFDRRVRSRVYALLAGGTMPVDVAAVARSGGWNPGEVHKSLSRLADDHRLTVKGDRVWMAHPFSGVPSGYRAVIGDRSWFANCAGDSLAILASLGDGEAHGPDVLVWEVEDGVVSPDGLVHLLVPARDFWDDIGYT